MKNNLIRTMALFVLVTSISGFALADDKKHEDPAINTSNTAQPNHSNQAAGDPVESNVSLKLDLLQKEVQHLVASDKERQDEEQKANQERRKQIRRDEKEWEHSLMGIYGG